MSRRKLEAWVSVDPEGKANPILCAKKEAALYQNTRTQSGKGRLVKLVEQGPARAIERASRALVARYCSNLGTSSEFVSCITPRGAMKEWEDLKKALGLPAFRQPRRLRKARGKR